MTIGVLTAELGIGEAQSLKDKRQVLKSVLAHLRNAFNVSAAEVDDNDLWRRATIGIAVVANNNAFANQVLDKVIDHLEADPRIDMGPCEIEFL